MNSKVTGWILGLALSACTVSAAEIVKLGTVAPEGSPWHDALLEVAQTWNRVSGGKVKLRIYAGGVAGDETDMIRKIRIGQLHAAALTSAGLMEIEPDIEAMTFPMVVRNDAELERVLTRIGPKWEKSLRAKGFELLSWSSAGWVRFFAKEPVVTPDDMRRRKLFFWGSDALYIELLKKSGFHPVPLSVGDLLPSLQTGLVDAFAAPPVAALAFQWFGLAPNMTDIKWQPLPAAIVISRRKWERIPPDLRPALRKSARKAGLRFQTESKRLETEAVEAMVKKGLKVIDVSPDVLADWREMVASQGLPVFMGRRFSRETYEEIMAVLRAYRSEGTGGKVDGSQ